MNPIHAPTLYYRYPHGDSKLSPRGAKISNNFSEIVKNFVDNLEKDSPLDFRDLIILLNEATSSVLINKIITRRLENPLGPKPWHS